VEITNANFAELPLLCTECYRGNGGPEGRRDRDAGGMNVSALEVIIESMHAVVGGRPTQVRGASPLRGLTVPCLTFDAGGNGPGFVPY
jgi:hypothetical protein